MGKHLDIKRQHDDPKPTPPPVKHEVEDRVDASALSPQVLAEEKPAESHPTPTTPLWVVLLSVIVILIIIGLVYYFIQISS